MKIDNALWNSLAAAEREAAQPVAPGELGPWTAAMHDQLDRIRGAWEAAAPERAAIERETTEKDPALAGRVKRIKEREQDLLRTLDSLQGRTERLRQQVLEDAAGSEENLDAVRKLRRDILGWIVDARVNGAERGAWRLESTYRERGQVD